MAVQVKVEDVYYSICVEVGLRVVAGAAYTALEGGRYDVRVRLVHDSVGVYVYVPGHQDRAACSGP